MATIMRIRDELIRLPRAWHFIDICFYSQTDQVDRRITSSFGHVGALLLFSWTRAYVVWSVEAVSLANMYIELQVFLFKEDGDGQHQEHDQ